MAIVPPPSKDREPEPLEARPAMSLWVRGTLVGIALGLTALFASPPGSIPTWKTAPPAAWKRTGSWDCPSARSNAITGYPCPSCGMTTSFALTIRGNLVDGVQANSVGVLLALFLLALFRGASPARSANAPCSSVRWSGP